MTTSIWDLVHPEYPDNWSVIIPNINFGDKVIYSGSQEKVRGALGVITAITHIKKADERFEWRFTIAIDDNFLKGKEIRLTNVREESFTKA